MKMEALLVLSIFFFAPSTSSMEQQQIRSQQRSIDYLKYSPGGAYFYKKFIIEHKSVVIKGAADDWPMISKWGSTSDSSESFMMETILIEEQPNTKHTVKDIIDQHLSVDVMLSKNTKLLEYIHLPLILQCQEFIDKLRDVRLQVNQPQKQNLEVAREDLLLVSVAGPLTVLMTDPGESDVLEEMEDKGLITMGDIKEAETYLQSRNFLYQWVNLEVGDLMYIPKYTWYLIGPTHPALSATFLTISFDFFPFTSQPNKQPKNLVAQQYNAFLSFQKKTLHCNNTRSSFGNSLNKAIDFKDEVGTSHLRIPKKNKRPDDVVLASGYTMPVLGLGTALLNETTYDAVKCALKEGYRLFDLAHGYPFSEESFGKAFHEQTEVKREDVFVVTKLQPRHLGYKETLMAIDDSLQRLNLDYIDLYLIHSKKCDDFLLKCGEGEPKGTWKDSWRAMEHAVREGKLRSIGASNFYGKEIYNLLTWSEEPVSVIQNWFDPFNQDKETRKICSENNIRFMGYSTLGNYWKMLGTNFNPVFTSSTLLGIASNYDYVIASVTLRWAIHENVTVIPRSSNPKHIGQNIRALDLSLLKAEIDAINKFDEWMGDLIEKDMVEDISKWTKEATV